MKTYKETIIELLRKNTLLYILLLGILVWNILWISKVSVFSILHPFRIHYGEDVLLEQARLFSEGKIPYTPLNRYPLTIGLYMPVYSLISAISIKFWGVSYTAGRILSLVSTVGISLCILFILKHINQSRFSWSGLIAGGLFLISPIVIVWSVIARVDMLGLFWTALGLLWFIKTYPKQIWMYSIVFFILAFFTKQSYLAAPATIICYLAFINRRHMVYFLLAFLISILGIFGILNMVTDGQFYFHMITANQNTLNYASYIGYIKKLFSIHTSLMMLCPVAILICFKKPIYRLWVIYFIFSFLASLSITKVGSNLNYFLEVICAMCLMTGMLFHRIHTLKQTQWTFLFLSIVSLVLFVPLVKSRMNTPNYVRYQYRNLTNIRKIDRYTSHIMNQVNGPIISEDMGLLVVNHKPILYQPFIISQLIREGRLDESPFIYDINSRMFPLLVLRVDIHKQDSTAHFSAGMIQAFRSHYRLVERVHYSYIYALK